jgi:hypothetical protein
MVKHYDNFYKSHMDTISGTEHSAAFWTQSHDDIIDDDSADQIAVAYGKVDEYKKMVKYADELREDIKTDKTMSSQDKITIQMKLQSIDGKTNAMRRMFMNTLGYVPVCSVNKGILDLPKQEVSCTDIDYEEKSDMSTRCGRIRVKKFVNQIIIDNIEFVSYLLMLLIILIVVASLSYTPNIINRVKTMINSLK